MSKNRIQELESFLEKFLSNFVDCEYCVGGMDGEDICRTCHGTGKHIESIGVLYVELPDEAKRLLAERKA